MSHIWKLANIVHSPHPKTQRRHRQGVMNRMIYGSETRPLLADVGSKFETAEMQTIRWMCDVTMKGRRTSEELRRRVGVELSWLGSVEADMVEPEIDREDVHDMKKWRKNVMKRKSNPIAKRTINR